MSQPILDKIAEWGRASKQTEVKDLTGIFNTEAVRKLLRQMYVNHEGQICGSYAKGYELILNTKERLGVTNQRHSSRFIVYYRCIS